MTDLEWLWCALGSRDGWWCFQRPGETWWTPVWKRSGFTGTAEGMLYAGDATVNAAPLVELGSQRLHGSASVLWCRVESRDSAARLARFKPEPSLVLVEGDTCRQTALWAIRRPLEPDECERANKRLAHHMRAPKKWSGAQHRIHLPGTVLREGRSRPKLVSVAGGSRDLYGAGQVVKRLRDAPDPDAWRQSAA